MKNAVLLKCLILIPTIIRKNSFLSIRSVYRVLCALRHGRKGLRLFISLSQPRHHCHRLLCWKTIKVSSTAADVSHQLKSQELLSCEKVFDRMSILRQTFIQKVYKWKAVVAPVIPLETHPLYHANSTMIAVTVCLDLTSRFKTVVIS